MKKRSLLATVVAGVAARTEVVVGEQEFRGRAATFGSEINMEESYAVLSCTQMEENGSSACSGQCAEVWCDSDEISGCTVEPRQTVRVVGQCFNCELGYMALSSNVYQQLSGANAYWIPVRWRCVDCGLSSGGSRENEGIEVRRMEEAICPGSSSRVGITPVEVGGGVISVENTTNEPLKMDASSGDSLISDLNLTASTDTDTSGSLDAVIKMPLLDNSTSSDSSSIWSDSGSTQIDANPWSRQGEKTASPTPAFLSVPSAISSPSSSSLPSSVNGDSFSPTPLPATTVSPANGGSWSAPPPLSPSSGGIVQSVSSPAGPANGDTSYPVVTVATSNEKPRDKAGLSTTTTNSTSHGGTTETPHKNRLPASSTASPAHSPRSIDKGSSDGNFSATSAVTRSPFFYASLMLGVVGLIGIIVGYRAKRKRNHRNEMRALEMSMRQSTQTPTSTSHRVPRSPQSLSRARLDSHDIVIL